MKAIEKYRALVSCLGKALAEHGYSGSGDRYIVTGEQCRGVIEFQRSRSADSRRVPFTVNLGICFDRLQEYFTPQLRGQSLRIEYCHWQERLGILLPQAQDKWWVVCEDAAACGEYEEIRHSLMQYGIPKMKALLGEHDILRLWLTGRSCGLTEFDRLMYLTTLMKLNEIGDGYDAVRRQLERLATGGPSESVVKDHFARLEMI